MLSQVAASLGWSVERLVTETVVVDGVEKQVETTVDVKARGLLSGDDAYWAIDNLVLNFTRFAPLGVVLVGMLGIGVAE